MRIASGDHRKFKFEARLVGIRFVWEPYVYWVSRKRPCLVTRRYLVMHSAVPHYLKLKADKLGPYKWSEWKYEDHH